MNVIVPLHTRTDVRRIVSALRAITVREAGEQFYRVDKRYADQYLWDRDDWRKLITSFFKELHEQDKDVVYADVCGRATARSLGATQNYSFSLQEVSAFADNEDGSLVCGDIFNARDFYSFLNLLRERRHFPAWVTFGPIAGLQSYTPYKKYGPLREQVVYQRLENNLRKTIEVLLPGGFIYLECPFQIMNLGDFFRRRSVEDYASTLWLKAFCARNKCSLRVKLTICGPRYLLRKRGRRK